MHNPGSHAEPFKLSLEPVSGVVAAETSFARPVHMVNDVVVAAIVNNFRMQPQALQIVFPAVRERVAVEVLAAGAAHEVFDVVVATAAARSGTDPATGVVARMPMAGVPTMTMTVTMAVPGMSMARMPMTTPAVYGAVDHASDDSSGDDLALLAGFNLFRSCKARHSQNGGRCDDDVFHFLAPAVRDFRFRFLRRRRLAGLVCCCVAGSIMRLVCQSAAHHGAMCAFSV